MPIQNRVPVRPASRDNVYAVIDGERDYQEDTWPAAERSLTPGEYIILFEEYVAKIRSQWVKEHGDENLKNGFRKLAGIAVRAMEVHGAVPREYHIPASANITGVMQARDDHDALALAPSRLADPRRQG